MFSDQSRKLNYKSQNDLWKICKYLETKYYNSIQYVCQRIKMEIRKYFDLKIPYVEIMVCYQWGTSEEILSLKQF